MGWGKLVGPLAVGGAIGVSALVISRWARGAVPSFTLSGGRADVVVMGDSLAVGLGGQLRQDVPGTVTEAEIGEAPSTTANRVTSRLAGKGASVVVIWTGANWLGREDKSAEDIAVEVDRAVGLAARISGVQGIIVVGQTVAPGVVYVGKAVEVDNILAGSFAHDPRIHLVPVPPEAYGYLAGDGLHFTANGYALVAGAVEELLV